MRGIEGNVDFIQRLPRDAVYNGLCYALQFAALCTKHPGFAEEQEWRLIHTPFDGTSPYVPGHVEVAGGIPQVVYKLPLKKPEGSNLDYINLDKLLYRVIIGPSNYPNQIADAFLEVLTSIGITGARERICVSHIPLRTVG